MNRLGTFRHRSWSLAVALLLALSGMAFAGDPCCTITAIDAEAGIITVTRSIDGGILRFQLDPAQVQGLLLGQTVELDDAGHLLAIHMPQPLPYLGETEINLDLPSAKVPEVAPADPCCTIAAVDAERRTITVVRRADERRFEFQLDEETLAGLGIGQAVRLDEAGNLLGIEHGTAAAPGADDRTPSLPTVRTAEVMPGDPCCNVTTKAGITARLGSLVVPLPEGVELSHARVRVYLAGTDQQVHDSMNGVSVMLPPGRYDVSISGQLVANVEVRGAHETNIKVGVLRLATPGARFHIQGTDPADGTRKVVVDLASGTGAILLPIGNYEVGLAGQFIPVSVAEWQVTDF